MNSVKKTKSKKQEKRKEREKERRKTKEREGNKITLCVKYVKGRGMSG